MVLYSAGEGIGGGRPAGNLDAADDPVLLGLEGWQVFSLLFLTCVYV